MDRRTMLTYPNTLALKMQNIPKDVSIEAVACWLCLATKYYPDVLRVQETASSLTAVALFRNGGIDLASATSFAQHNAIDGQQPTLEMLSMPVSIRVYSAKGMLTEAILQKEFSASTKAVLLNSNFAQLTIFDYAAYLAALEYTTSEHVDIRVVSYNHDADDSEWYTYTFRAEELLHVAPVATPLQLVAKGVPPESVTVLNEQLKRTLADLHVTPAALVFFNDSVLISCLSEQDYRHLKDRANSNHGLQLCGVRLSVKDLLSDSATNASNCDVLLHNLGEVTKDEVKYFAWALADVPVTKVEFVRERNTKELSALVSFDSPLDIGRLCKRLELIQLSGLTLVAERVRPSCLAIVSDLPANVDPSVVVSVLDEAQTPVISCCPTKITGQWLLTFSSSQVRDAAVDASQKMNLPSGTFILRREFLHNSVEPADGHRTRRELNLRFLKAGYWQYAWQHDREWVKPLLVNINCELDRNCEYVRSLVRCSRNRQRGVDAWADLRYTFSKVFEERYDCFVLPWPHVAWKVVSKPLYLHRTFPRCIRRERGGVAILAVAPSGACDSCRREGVCRLALDAEADRGIQACRRDIRYRISRSCRCAPSAMVIGIRDCVSTLLKEPELVNLLQSNVAASTACCLPAVAQLLSACGAAMAGDAISVAVDEPRSQVTFVGDALIASRSIEFFRDPAGPIYHCEVPLTHASRALLATNRSRTARLIRRVVAQSILAKGLTGQLTWMVHCSSHAAVVLFAASEVVLQMGRCIFEDLIANGSHEWPVGYHQSPEDDDATCQKLQKLCDEYRPAVVQAKPAGGGFGPCITFACRQSSAPALTTAISTCLHQEVSVTTMYDIHPVLALWLHRPAVAPQLRELQLPTRSIADGRVLSFALPDPASGCEVIVMQGTQAGIETLKLAVASLLCLDQFKVLKVTLRVPGGQRYLASMEGKRMLESIMGQTGTMIALVQQGGLRICSSASVTQTGNGASETSGRDSDAQVTSNVTDFDDRSCCLWQGVWLAVQRACPWYVDCDAIVVASEAAENDVSEAAESDVDEAAESDVSEAAESDVSEAAENDVGEAAENDVSAAGGSQVGDAQVDYLSAAMAAEDLLPVTVSVDRVAGLRCKAVLCITSGLPIGQLLRPDAIKEQFFLVVFRALSTAAELGHRVVVLTCFRGAEGNLDTLGAADSATQLVSAVKQVLRSPSLIGRLSRVLFVDESPGIVKLLRSSMEREFADMPRSRLVPPPFMGNGLTFGMSTRQKAVISGQASGPLASAISSQLELLDIAAATGIIKSPTDITGAADGASRLAQLKMAVASNPLAATSQATVLNPLATGPIEQGRAFVTSVLHSTIAVLDVLFRPPFTIPQLPSGASPCQLPSSAQPSVEQLSLPTGQLSWQTSFAAASLSNKLQSDAAGVEIHVRYMNLVEQEADAYFLPIGEADHSRDKFTRDFLVQVPFRWPFTRPLAVGSAYEVAAPANCRCKHLIFAVCIQHGSPFAYAEHVYKALEAALYAAERNGLSTIAIMPFGVGCGSFLAYDAAVLARKSIQNFIRLRRSNTNFRIIIVVPTVDLLQAFEGTFADLLAPRMSYGRGIASNSWSDQAVRQLMDSIGISDESVPSDAAVLICGTEDSVFPAASHLLERCRSKLKAKCFVVDDSQELLTMLSPEQMHQLSRVARKHGDGMELWREYERPTNGSNIGRSVLKLASLDDKALASMIQQLVEIIRLEKAALTEENRPVSSAVWQHRFEPLGFWHNYEATLSRRLEQAYTAQESLVTYVNAAGTYDVDLRLMTDTMTGSAVNVSRVRRLAITSSDLPSYWIQSNIYTEVSLRMEYHTEEFSAVASAFAGSLGMPHTILEILRIQNPTLWRQYMVKKEDTLRNLMFQAAAEWDLWHGAPASAVRSICQEGFNRSLCGKNGVRYGQGTYFARHASYAASSQFAVHDRNNVKCILLAKVLVGDFEQGYSDMRVTHYKPYSKIPRRFDSSVNDTVNPTIFVTYNDAQAYPAYVVKFI